jgi:hypothetical protein
MAQRSGQISEEDKQMANMHMKICSTSYFIRKLQIKTTLRHQYTPTRLSKIQNSEHQLLVRMESERTLYSLLMGMQTYHGHAARQFGSFLQN